MKAGGVAGQARGGVQRVTQGQARGGQGGAAGEPQAASGAAAPGNSRSSGSGSGSGGSRGCASMREAQALYLASCVWGAAPSTHPRGQSW